MLRCTASLRAQESHVQLYLENLYFLMQIWGFASPAGGRIFFRFWTPKTIDCPLEINRKDAQNEKNPACGGLSFEDISIYSETVVNDIR